MPKRKGNTFVRASRRFLKSVGCLAVLSIIVFIALLAVGLVELIHWLFHK